MADVTAKHTNAASVLIRRGLTYDYGHDAGNIALIARALADAEQQGKEAQSAALAEALERAERAEQLVEKIGRMQPGLLDLIDDWPDESAGVKP